MDLVLAIGMAKQPEQRFRTAFELAAAIAGAMAGTLPDNILERGRQLDRAGAWSPAATRASTSPMRAARPPR
jgi:hypothetical protein